MKIAALAFLTSPSPGVFLLNVKFDGEEIERIEITKGQLGNMVADGAGFLFRVQQVKTTRR